MVNPLTQEHWLNRVTLKQVLVAGLLFRLLAVVFSKGYAFHDDHFEMAELVQRWRDGYSFLWSGSDVHVFSLIYPGFLYLVFESCHAIGLHEPEQIMFVLRMIHGLFSLLAIYYSYKLSLRISGQHIPAILTAILMAVLWVFPFLSVRNLREVVCIPFLLAGSYLLADTRFSYRGIILAALCFALAFCIRLQVVFIPLGIGLYLLLQKTTIKKSLVFGIAFIICCFLTQGLFDLLYYGNPVASVAEYFRFNADEANIEIQPRGPWYQYIGTVAGLLLGLPFFLLAFGFVYSWKLKTARMLLIGSLLFFVFHSWYSNKQERFILPFLPFFIILGISGFYEFYKQSLHKKWLVISTRLVILWFIVLNTLALVVLSTTYTKRARVESMIYLRNKGDVSNLIVESEHGSPRPPLFYLGKQLNYFSLTLADSLPVTTNYLPKGNSPEPNYIIMAGEEKRETRLARLKRHYPSLTFEKKISPGFIDNLAHRLNPKHNESETWSIYKITGGQ